MLDIDLQTEIELSSILILLIVYLSGVYDCSHWYFSWFNFSFV